MSGGCPAGDPGHHECSYKPLVERVAGWSARHRIIAVVGWLVLVALALTVGQRLGQGNVKSYDPGQAGQAERALNSPVVPNRLTENILVQARSAARSYASAPELRQATADVVPPLRALPHSAKDIRSPLTSPPMTHRPSALA